MASALIYSKLKLKLLKTVYVARVFRDAYSDFDFIARYRITKYMFVDLLNKISTKLNRSNARSHSIAPTT